MSRIHNQRCHAKPIVIKNWSTPRYPSVNFHFIFNVNHYTHHELISTNCHICSRHKGQQIASRGWELQLNVGLSEDGQVLIVHNAPWAALDQCRLLAKNQQDWSLADVSLGSVSPLRVFKVKTIPLKKGFRCTSTQFFFHTGNARYTMLNCSAVPSWWWRRNKINSLSSDLSVVQLQSGKFPMALWFNLPTFPKTCQIVLNFYCKTVNLLLQNSQSSFPMFSASTWREPCELQTQRSPHDASRLSALFEETFQLILFFLQFVDDALGSVLLEKNYDIQNGHDVAHTVWKTKTNKRKNPKTNNSQVLQPDLRIAI